jgi:plastocyanin
MRRYRGCFRFKKIPVWGMRKNIVKLLPKHNLCHFSLLAVILLFSMTAQAFEIVVKDDKGQPVQNVAVALYPEKEVKLPSQAPQDVIQQDKVFDPFVTVVAKGTTVMFPNKDSVRHHVYSLSKAKQFELPLYRGDSKPVVFDHPGVVSVGCNIHDWMLAYIAVVETPYFAKTNSAGIGDIRDLPAGTYRLKYWYPGIQGAQDLVPVGGAIAASQRHYDITVSAGTVQAMPDKPVSADDSSTY